ncbi:acyl-CoA synthetase (AMP-forming)/AMP-acid ligase II [Brevibacterium sanguinis]|uniref:Acyl-CoA synthetase (AMP-forming)/AMP-acid ligase II n=2 Tax=Brevibacterium TaxID=1696 RepID=A0A366IK78_9MICO|nr:MULTISPECIES: AMP-binding protein [Brevibacterium]RBP65062.1 acyl-CoA synthetase (AMP-forming)/AMP-acid ligase II [Brevibacterium sanguinis]RBP71325.1 acyl-CoA synthetase (AMP-forming)/AMP-acid ligase II [Brevibacterium celere]
MRSISRTSPAKDFTPTPRRGVNVSHFLTQTARRIPDAPAVIDPDRGITWSWRELDERADALALDLQRRGVARRDSVVLVSANHAEVIQAFWGAIRAGAVIAPPNAALSTEELLGICEEVRPAALIVDREHTDFVEALHRDGYTGPVLWIGELPTTVTGPLSAAVPESARVRRGHGGPSPDSADEITALGDFEVEEDDPCWYFFTSGSTGRPKAATFTHRHLGAVLANHRCDLFPDEDETGASLVIAPLSHGAGIHMLAQVFGGTPSVIHPGGRADPLTLWESIDRFGITNAFTVPTILNRIVAGLPDDRGPGDHTLRRVVYAGAPMLAADQARALDRLGPCLVQYFGLAEVTGAITILRPEEHGAIPVDEAGIGTCGRARTGVEILIVDESGTPTGPGVSGEVCVAGPTVCAGYLGRPDANAESFAGGIFHTGDIGYLDERGYLYLTGRKSDMYISGGSNVYPREIEELLLTSAEVAQAVVVGVPDPQWGEIGVAVIELAPAAPAVEPERPPSEGEHTDHLDRVRERLRSLLKSRLAPYKVPKEIHFVDRIPVTAYGKIARREIRDEQSRGRGSAR